MTNVAQIEHQRQALPSPPHAGFYAWRNRLLALAILLPSATLVGLSAWLTPDPSGVGTHLQLGIRACSTLALTGYPCPTCGMTTAFTLAAHGRIFSAFATQPAGAFLAIFNACAVLVSFYSLIVGLSLFRLVNALWQPRPLIVLGGIMVAGWIYKIFMTCCI